MKSCDTCEKAAFGSGGVYCTEFHEQINDTSVAEECGMYQPLPGAVELVILEGGATPVDVNVRRRKAPPRPSPSEPFGTDTEAKGADSKRARSSHPSMQVDVPDRSANCGVCGELIGWITCPTGSWWAHDSHPADDHEATPASPSSAAENASTPVEPPPSQVEPWNGDAEHRLVVQVDIPYYGKPEQSVGSLNTLKRLVALHLRGSVVTELPSSQWKGTP